MCYDHSYLKNQSYYYPQIIFLLGNFVRSVYLEIENTTPEVIDKWQSDIKKRVEKGDLSLKNWLGSGKKNHQKITGAVLPVDYFENLKKK